MGLQTDQELVAFLTTPDNSRFVLEILRRRDELCGELIQRFFDSLKNHLETQLPQSRGWELSVTAETDDLYAALVCLSKGLESENQYLRFAVELSREENDGTEIALCLAWVDGKVCENKRLHSPKTVTELVAHLKKAGFRKGGARWVSYKYLFKHASDEEFLLRILNEEERNTVVRQISDSFCPLVQRTAKQLASANADIVRVIATQPIKTQSVDTDESEEEDEST